MIYLKSFHLPDISEEEFQNERPREYPYGIFSFKKLEDVDFQPVTLFYGNNGSGKSTLLNLIGEALRLPRRTVFRGGQRFPEYLEKCHYVMETDEEGLERPLQGGSRNISSEEIFDHILSIRRENLKIDKRKELQESDYLEAKYGSVQVRSLEDYERLKSQNAARRLSMSEFVTRRAGKNLSQYSNGETALSYFNEQFIPGGLYLLDEPENSLSPVFQLKLADMILECARYCDCQFIIASHSPFLLSMEDARVYDLDSVPVTVRQWYELENMRVSFDLFQRYKACFLQE